jgi:hypothetical protein
MEFIQRRDDFHELPETSEDLDANDDEDGIIKNLAFILVNRLRFNKNTTIFLKDAEIKGKLITLY